MGRMSFRVCSSSWTVYYFSYFSSYLILSSCLRFQNTVLSPFPRFCSDSSVLAERCLATKSARYALTHTKKKIDKQRKRELKTRKPNSKNKAWLSKLQLGLKRLNKTRDKEMFESLVLVRSLRFKSAFGVDGSFRCSLRRPKIMRAG